jgi:murein DD-endopeptidase MepM/ murein hydrolase activator NlpD
LAWAWPSAGTVLAGFEEGKQKGLAIAGKAGDPVLAAADGRVVYAGAGLRGYGNLVIVKHNATYLTAYAHNQTLLVKDEQVVRRGQKIAEMGSSDAERVQLHFEIRRWACPSIRCGCCRRAEPGSCSARSPRRHGPCLARAIDDSPRSRYRLASAAFRFPRVQGSSCRFCNSLSAALHKAASTV